MCLQVQGPAGSGHTPELTARPGQRGNRLLFLPHPHRCQSPSPPLPREGRPGEGEGRASPKPGGQRRGWTQGRGPGHGTGHHWLGQRPAGLPPRGHPQPGALDKHLNPHAPASPGTLPYLSTLWGTGGPQLPELPQTRQMDCGSCRLRGRALDQGRDHRRAGSRRGLSTRAAAGGEALACGQPYSRGKPASPHGAL